MEYLVVTLSLIVGFAGGFAGGFAVGFALCARVSARLMHAVVERVNRDSNEGIQVDPRLSEIIRQRIVLANQAEYPAAAGQDECGEAGPMGKSCDRPDEHEGPHAWHQSHNLVRPAIVWEEV